MGSEMTDNKSTMGVLVSRASYDTPDICFGSLHNALSEKKVFQKHIVSADPKKKKHIINDFNFVH